MIDFPNSPTTGQIFTSGSTSWRWDGSKWVPATPTLTNYAPGQLPGTTTNDNAAAGQVGEYRSQILLSGSAVSLSTTTWTGVVSLTLTAGDWNVWGELWWSAPGGSTGNGVLAAINVSTGTPGGVPSDATGIAGLVAAWIPGVVSFIAVPPVRVSLSANANYTLMGYCYLASGGSPTGYGKICARRVR